VIVSKPTKNFGGAVFYLFLKAMPFFDEKGINPIARPHFQ
jgi:hypothetical protein